MRGHLLPSTTACLVLMLFQLLNHSNVILAKDDEKALDVLWKTPAELARLRGFIAEDHYITTFDGHLLNLIRILNPLINNGTSGLPSKKPLLFIHGVFTDAACFIYNSANARPKNYANLDVNSMSIKDLNDLLLKDPNSKNLPFTASSFGHEVWLFNRRGTKTSLGYVGKENQPFSDSMEDVMETLLGFMPNVPKVVEKLIDRHKRGEAKDTIKLDNSKVLHPDVKNSLQTAYKNLVKAFNLTEALNLENKSSVPLPQLNFSMFQNTFNPRFWNYSFDEQARYDIPQAIDYVLAKTNSKKLALIGHSVGGSLILMSLADQPKISKKISKAILWSPAMDLGNTDDVNILVRMAQILYPVMIPYIGPVPIVSLQIALQYLLGNICSNQMGKNLICEPAISLIVGPGGGQQNMEPGYFGHLFTSVSSHEAASLFNAVISTKARYFDYEDPRLNKLAYGSSKAPFYNVGKIKSNAISIWAGNKDALVTPIDTKILLNDLKVPYDFHYLDGPGLYFNHYSFLIHKNVAKLLIIPTLKTLYKYNPKNPGPN